MSASAPARITPFLPAKPATRAGFSVKNASAVSKGTPYISFSRLSSHSSVSGVVYVMPVQLPSASNLGWLPHASLLMVMRAGSAPCCSAEYTAAAVPFSLSTVSAVKSAVPPILLNFTASLISSAVRQQCVGRKVSAGSSEFSTASKSGFSLSFPLPTCIMTYPFLPLSMLLTRTSVPRRANSCHVTFEPRWSDMAIFTPIISPISAMSRATSPVRVGEG